MKKTSTLKTNMFHIKLFPRLALKGIVSNGNVYYPYMAASIFSVFTYFVFTSILKNDIIKILPKSAYAWLMLSIGKGLLSIILFLFLLYANSFLVKRRCKEFGMYHILGLEKKHISVMMFWETLLIYAGAIGGGIVLGTVLSKLLFLILLRVCRLPVDIRFIFEPEAFVETLVYFGGVYAVNFVGSLWQVGKARPVELMSGSRKGEKEPRLLWIYAVLGVLTLGWGYYCSITSKVDSMIFINFFMAVFLVITGTYFLFTSGSVALLKWMKSRRKIYYKPNNFITISGMFYRMKKSAAGLSNICIFSTMVMITLICTTSLCIGLEESVRFVWPYDINLSYQGEKVSAQEAEEEIGRLEKKYDIRVRRVDIYDKLNLSVRKAGSRFAVPQTDHEDGGAYGKDYQMGIMTQEDYNHVSGQQISLGDDEALIYCNGADYGYDTVNFYGRNFQVQEETESFFPDPKAQENTFGANYMMVVKDERIRDQCVLAWCEANGVTAAEELMGSETQYVQVLLEGRDEEKTEWLAEFGMWGQSQAGFREQTCGVEQRDNLQIMYGALMFVGVLFGLIFFMCLILIMYYKQVTEGYEDRDSFDIMQKVGMSDREIQSTIHRQILLVFGMPLTGALLHTIAGMFMVKGLFVAIALYNTVLLGWCTVAIAVLFTAVYGGSYLVTARTYYQIVRRR